MSMMMSTNSGGWTIQYKCWRIFYREDDDHRDHSCSWWHMPYWKTKRGYCYQKGDAFQLWFYSLCAQNNWSPIATIKRSNLRKLDIVVQTAWEISCVHAISNTMLIYSKKMGIIFYIHHYCSIFFYPIIPVSTPIMTIHKFALRMMCKKDKKLIAESPSPIVSTAVPEAKLFTT